MQISPVANPWNEDISRRLGSRELGDDELPDRGAKAPVTTIVNGL